MVIPCALLRLNSLCSNRTGRNARSGPVLKIFEPSPDRIVPHIDAAFIEKVLDISEQEQKPDAERHRQSNDFRVRVEVPERIAFWRSATLAEALARL